MSEVSEAAQRIVQPEPAPPIPQSVQPAAPAEPWVPPKPVQPFDFVAPKPQTPVAAQPLQPTDQPTYQPVDEPTPAPQAQIFVQPEPQPTVQLAPDPIEPTTPPQIQFTPIQTPTFQSSLPTDLPTPAQNEPKVQTNESKKAGKFALPKLGMPQAIAGMAIALFIVGAGVAFMGFKTNKDVEAQVKGTSNQQTQDPEGGLGADGVPHEDGFPPDVRYYRTAASYPRVIRIAKTSTEARVLPFSIMPTGALKAPGNIFDVGWYKDSAKPGEAGALVLDGHVSGPTKPGVFKNLGTLKTGDTIEIERGDGELFEYTVEEVKVFDADKLDMSSVMVPRTPGKQGLNIITCGGKFNKETNKYEQRTVVYATR